LRALSVFRAVAVSATRFVVFDVRSVTFTRTRADFFELLVTLVLIANV
jgi:hypothetical protein